MFLRKFTVMILPLVMLAALCILIPAISAFGFFSFVLKGLCLGVALALLLPLSGATRQREPFGVLLWVPLLVMILVVVYQYMALSGITLPVLALFATEASQVVLIESAFIGFMAATCLRCIGA